jgi:hypothetical protein
MRKFTSAIYSLLFLTMAACSSVDIQPSAIDAFEAANYSSYKWRSEPILPDSETTDSMQVLDQAMRREVNASLQAKGYRLDEENAQFSVGYLFAISLRDGVTSDQGSNISPVPTATINRQVDQASVDNAIALGGLKETSNVLLQFNDVAKNKEVWRVLMSEVVQNVNRTDNSHVDGSVTSALAKALRMLPEAAQ